MKLVIGMIEIVTYGKGSIIIIGVMAKNKSVRVSAV